MEAADTYRTTAYHKKVIFNIYAVQQDTQSVSMSEFIQHLC